MDKKLQIENEINNNNQSLIIKDDVKKQDKSEGHTNNKNTENSN